MSLKPGLVTLAEAKANREWFEAARESVTLPTGTYQVDRAPWLRGPLMVDGQGSTILNSTEGANYPLNSSLLLRGTGSGHVDRMVPSGPNLLLESTAAAANYVSGRVVYCFRSEEYGLICQRRLVKSRTGSTVTLNQAIDQRCNAVTWLANSTFIVANVNRGDHVVFVSVPKLFVAGQFAFLTSGCSTGNELRGEFLQIKSVNGNRIEFFRGSSRDYVDPALAVLSAASDITFKNFTFGQPVNPHADAVLMTHAHNIRFERCTFTGQIGCGQITDLEFVDCMIRGKLFLNTSTRVMVSGCTTIGHGVYMDEADTETTVENWVCLHPHECAVRMGLETSRFVLRDAMIVGGGASPFIAYGSDNRFERVTIRGNTFDSYMRGHRMVIDDLTTPGNVVACDGDNQLLRRVRCMDLHLGWVVSGGPSNGRVTECSPKNVVSHPAANGWKIE